MSLFSNGPFPIGRWTRLPRPRVPRHEGALGTRCLFALASHQRARRKRFRSDRVGRCARVPAQRSRHRRTQRDNARSNAWARSALPTVSRSRAGRLRQAVLCVLARARAEGGDPRTLRRIGDRPLLSRFRKDDCKLRVGLEHVGVAYLVVRRQRRARKHWHAVCSSLRAMKRSAIFLLLLAPVLGQCVPQARVSVARSRGAQDLECPSERVRVYRTAEGLYVARGCGKWVEYDCLSSGRGTIYADTVCFARGQALVHPDAPPLD